MVGAEGEGEGFSFFFCLGFTTNPGNPFNFFPPPPEAFPFPFDLATGVVDDDAVVVEETWGVEESLEVDATGSREVEEEEEVVEVRIAGGGGGIDLAVTALKCFRKPGGQFDPKERERRGAV